MKTLILFVALLFIGKIEAQQQIVKYPGYKSYWNPKTLIPDSVIYVAKPHAKAAERA